MTLAPLARRCIASLPTPIRWRTRNAIALARWLRVRAHPRAGQTTYDDEFWELHASGDWNGLAEVVWRFCHPASVVDVGCGDGKLLSALRSRSSGLTLLGIDSSDEALARAAAEGIAVERYDLSSMRRRDLERLRARLAGFELAISLETAEHLPPWSGAQFIGTLTRARRVVFSAAHPGQGGTLHMNERPAAYWSAKFAAHGFQPSAADASFRDAVAALALPWWYAANVHLFERRP